MTDGCGRARSVRERGPVESKQRKQWVDFDPCGERVVVAEAVFIGFARQREAFDEADAASHFSETAATIIDSAFDDFKSQCRPAFSVQTQNGGIGVDADGINIVKKQGPQAGSLLDEAEERSVEEEIWDFEPMADRMQALRGEVVAVVAALTGGAGPVHERVLHALPHFLFSLIKDLVSCFLVGKPKIPVHGHEP